jgi:RNA polymerase sigma-70 factor (sigma-E family)
MSGRDEVEAAFSGFVAARYPAMVRTAYLLTGDRGHAEDLVQAALLRTFTSWSRLDAPENAEAYTRTTMIRLAGRAYRRRWRGELSSASIPDLAGADPADGVAQEQWVRAALLALPWPQRAVIVLRYFDDRSEADIATALGCSVGTVKSRASRGLEALRAAGLLREDSSADEKEEVGRG